MATLIIGIGNAFRGDDAVGLRVAEALGVSESVRQHDGEPASLIALWEGWDDVVLIDAVTWGRPPGTIVEMDAADSQIPAGVCHSTHALGPAEAIELARALATDRPEFLACFERAFWQASHHKCTQEFPFLPPERQAR